MSDRRAAFPFVMCGLAFACFLLVLAFMAKTVQPLWGRTLLLLLPSLLLFGVGVLARKGIPGPEKTAAVTAILTVVLLLLSIGYVFLLSIWTATTTTTPLPASGTSPWAPKRKPLWRSSSPPKPAGATSSSFTTHFW